MSLKVGVVGCKGIGELHCQSHAKDSLADFVAVCDLVKSRADEMAAKYNVKAYYKLEEMLEAHLDLDVVDIATGGNENGGWHFEPTMIALAAGKNVLVEKPMSNSITEAREMVRFADEKNLYLGCNLNHYFTEPARQAKELMSEGKIGEQIYCLHRMGFNGGEADYNPLAVGGPNFEGFPYAHLKAFLAHPFGLMRHFCGDITHLQAFMDKPSYRRHANDLMVSIASIHVKFENGAIGYLFSQRGDARMGLGGWWSIEVGGTKGTFCIENCVEKLTYYGAPAGEKPEPVVTDTGEKDFGTTFPNRLHAYLEDVTNQVPHHKLRGSGRDALATLEYTFAAIESYEQGGTLVRPASLPQIKRNPLDY